MLDDPFVHAEITGREAAEDHFFHRWMILDRGADGRHGDLRGQLDGIAVDTGADAREGQRGEAMLAGELDGGSIARGEELGLALATAAPDRADRVNHVSRGEAIAARDPASPVWHPPRRRHSSRSSGPAARWMAPSTPPPPSSEVLASMKMACTESVVMSAWIARSRVGMRPARLAQAGAMLAFIRKRFLGS